MTWMVLILTLTFERPADPGAADVELRIARGIAWATSAIEGSPDAVESLRGLASSLPNRATFSISQIRDGDIQPQEVSVRYDWLRLELHRALDELPDNTRLQRLVDYASSYERPGPDDAVAFDETDYVAMAEDILSRREFQPKTESNGLSDLLSRLFQKLWDLLRDLLPTPEPVSPQLPAELTGVGQFIMYALIGVGGMLLIWVIVKLIRHYRKKESLENAGERHPLLERGESVEPDEHWRRAQTEAAAGNYRRAIRHVVLSVILHLDRHERIRYQKHLTNLEYGELIRIAKQWPMHHTAYGAWQNLAALFDRVWYGNRTATAKDFDHAAQCRQHMIQDVPEAVEVMRT